MSTGRRAARTAVRAGAQFPDYEQVTTLARQLGWSHVNALLALKSDEARAYYAAEASTKHLSVRELHAAMEARHAICETANAQIPERSAVPRDLVVAGY